MSSLNQRKHLEQPAEPQEMSSLYQSSKTNNPKPEMPSKTSQINAKDYSSVADHFNVLSKIGQYQYPKHPPR